MSQASSHFLLSAALTSHWSSPILQRAQTQNLISLCFAPFAHLLIWFIILHVWKTLIILELSFLSLLMWNLKRLNFLPRIAFKGFSRINMALTQGIPSACQHSLIGEVVITETKELWSRIWRISEHFGWEFNFIFQ